ncbi:uncharacterized protein CDAR_413921 [Caerostris darwini]|uniref:Uncharacterized protein n=1 Tax=Caerostris darwini TaxID=1538125 RepID=A0AAV4RF77_9ARAC|nr:uncharacterized protein CDAR_413921 [Caerostris darwini]
MGGHQSLPVSTFHSEIKSQKSPSNADVMKPGLRFSGSMESNPKRGQGRRSNRHRSLGGTFQRPGSPLGRIFDTSTEPSGTTQRSRRFNDLWVRMDTYGKKFIHIGSSPLKDSPAPQQAFQTWFQKSHGPDHILSSGSTISTPGFLLRMLMSVLIFHYHCAFQLIFHVATLTGIT